MAVTSLAEPLRSKIVIVFLDMATDCVVGRFVLQNRIRRYLNREHLMRYHLNTFDIFDDDEMCAKVKILSRRNHQNLSADRDRYRIIESKIVGLIFRDSSANKVSRLSATNSIISFNSSSEKLALHFREAMTYKVDQRSQ